MATRRGLREASCNINKDSVPTPTVGIVSAADFKALVEVMTNVMTAAVNATMECLDSAAAAVKKIMKSIAIYPCDMESMNLPLKEGKHYWKMVTQREEGWKLISLTTNNSDVLVDLFKD